MCRWIAYSGETIALEQYVTEPAHSLLAQSFQARESAAATNGDGFGLGWYGERREPGLYREVRPAWSDENLHHLCRHLRSHLFFAHVRASTGTPTTRQNCHPFACGPWLFMHNGFIGGWKEVRRKIEALIPDRLYQSRSGTTDSEAIFLAILGQGLADGSADPVTATSDTMRRLWRIIEEGSGDVLRFTAAITDGRNLYAFRYAVNESANSLYYRATDSGVVVVSEPLDWGRSNWTPVPNNSVVVVRPGQPPEVTQFLGKVHEDAEEKQETPKRGARAACTSEK